ncbi:hypothetical protein P691DRAFT_768538 [Macrolepiota fuliginosa MF-IS2]|uniref:Uncharacterized protein n=1 Tax=Macrolepiota fuliginosa MF-IS2 TaxID=1400762 RepID=A0A9P6BVN0_9AGAR|nr:hypothetical protein P691DRAFT_768538 [Macrolepiota fuliginosa MF-IS2]
MSTPPISAIPPHLQIQYQMNTLPITPPVPATTYSYLGQPQPGYMAPALLQGYPQPRGSILGHSTPAYVSQPQPQQPGSYPTYPPLNSPPTSIGYGIPPPAVAAGGHPQNAPAPGFKPEMLAVFPEEQKALIMHIISMMQDQLNKLPLEQRTTYMQIVNPFFEKWQHC